MSFMRIAAAAFGSLLFAISSAQASVEISAAPTKHMSCTSGVCSPTAKSAVLNTTDLANMLATGDVKVVTGNGAVTITISAPFSWTSTHRLTLDANLNVSFRAPVEVTGTGAVTIVTNDGGTGGDLLFFPGASLDFWDTSSSLNINGRGYTLVGDLATMVADISANQNGYYSLARSYDATADGPYSNSPITTVFTGMFEGLGHSIKNLQINIPQTTGTLYIGLFQQLGRGTLRDIGVENIQINIPHETGYVIEYVGTLAGRNGSDTKGPGTILNSYATGSINSYPNRGEVGGLVGFNTGTVIGSYSLCSITITDETNLLSAAGLVAENDGLIANSHASGTLTARFAAGLVSQNSAEIDDSYFDGSLRIYGDDNDDGGSGGAGLVAGNDGKIQGSHASSDIARIGSGPIGAAGLVFDNNSGALITRSYATGSMASKGVGGSAGLVGYNMGQVDTSFATGDSAGTKGQAGGLVALNTGTILNCYASGAVSGARGGQGGLIGHDEVGTIKTSYSIGAVTGGKGTRNGGMIGTANGTTAADAYWDIDTSDQHRSAAGKRISDTQLKSGLPTGFDPNVWAQNPSINNGYPYLIDNPPPR